MYVTLENYQIFYGVWWNQGMKTWNKMDTGKITKS